MRAPTLSTTTLTVKGQGSSKGAHHADDGTSTTTATFSDEDGTTREALRRTKTGTSLLHNGPFLEATTTTSKKKLMAQKKKN